MVGGLQDRVHIDACLRFGRWEESGFFEPVADAESCFVIPMPPPNVTGRLHMGHAMFVAMQDVMIRFARMRGKSALWLPGTDHAGIATQVITHDPMTTVPFSECTRWLWREC